MLLPGVPRRLLDDIGEMKDLCESCSRPSTS